MTTMIAQDTFASRSVTGSSSVSFGAASDGESWQAPLGGLSHTVFGVASGEGFLYSDGTGSAGGLASLGSIAFRDIDLTCRFTFGTVTGNPLFYLTFRVTDINNLYDITVNATTGAVRLERWASGGNNTSFAMGTFGALTAGSYYHLRVQADGTTFRARVWADGTAEPGSFAYSATDPFAGRQVAGFFGVGVTAVAATTQATGVQFDHLVASILYPGQHLYVSPTGSDSTGDGSSGNPWKTVQVGLNAISPSGTLHLAPGTYAGASGVGLIMVASGNAANRIVVQSDAKWAAKITGTNIFTIFQVNGNYVDVLGIDLSATDSICSYGLVFSGNFCTAQNGYYHDILAVNSGSLGGAGISGQNAAAAYLSGPVDVIGNLIARIGQDSPANNNSSFVHGIYMSCQGNLIQNNIVVGCGGTACNLGHGASNYTVSNNTFVGNLCGGLVLWAGGAGVGLGTNDHDIVTNNLIAHNTGTITTQGATGIDELSPGVGPHNTYANNLLFDNILSTTAPFAGLQYEFLSGGTMTGALFVSPQLVNYQPDGSGDYHLTATSPCVDAGVTTGAPATDYDGALRPRGAGYDIGAYELQATSVLGTDTFAGRTVASGLGTASDGQVWTHDTGTSNGSVGSNEGKVTGVATAGNTFRLGSVTSARQNVSMRVKYSGTGDIVGVIGRRTAATTFYRAVLRAGNFEIRLNNAGVITQLVSTATTALSPNPFTFAVNTFYWIRFDLNGTTLQAKVWPDGHTEPASYQLSVTNSTITAAGGFGLYALVNPTTDSVSFDSFAVTAGLAAVPVLAAAPATLTFNAVVGGASPATQNDTLSETAGVATAWTSAIVYGSGGSGWLGIAASSGSLTASGTATIVYTCTTGALAVGTYTATVTYTATTGALTATVGVTFVVNATTAVLSTAPSTLAFSAMVGGSNPATQNDVLSNVGGTTSAWTSAIVYGSGGSGWLGIAASSGSLTAGASATIIYTCTTGALAIGTYTATVTYTATTGGATATVVVTFTITSAATTYLTYKNTIEPNMVAAMATHNLLNFVQLIGPDTTMANDSWLTSSSADLSNTLGGYVRHAFPTGINDIANDSRENAVRTLVAGIYANDNTNKPVIQGEMGFGAMGPGQSVNSYQYGVEMTDYAVQLARAGMAVLIAYLLDDDMHGTQWGMWEITADTGVPRPWFFPWAVLTQTLVPGSQLYAPQQPASNDFRFLAARSPQGAWTFVMVNRKAVAVNAIVQVPFAPVATNSMQSYTYSDAAPLLVDGSGFPLPSGTVSAVLARGFTMSMAANSVLILSQQTATTASLFAVKRPPLQRRR